MKYPSSNRQRRQGAVTPLMAILLVPLLGMVAFAVDMGYLTLVQAELQNTADAAALAGVQELMDPYTQWVLINENPTLRDPVGTKRTTILNNAVSKARQTAKTFATYNTAGSTNISLLDADVKVGFLAANGTFTSPTPSGKFPNSVQVLARRDSSANGSVGMFFATAIGTSNVDLSATARATLFTGRITGFSPTMKGGMLPMTFDVRKWNEFLRGDIDGLSDIVTQATDGTPQIQVYPYKPQGSKSNSPGYFGELSLSDEHTGSSEVIDWIRNGVPTDHIQILNNNGLVPLSNFNADGYSDNKNSDWRGNTGVQSNTIMEVNDNVGKEYILPLYYPYKTEDHADGYEPAKGNGSNHDYSIVNFVSVKIMEPEKANKGIIVQPSGYVDPASVLDMSTLQPADPDNTYNGNPILTFAAPRLTM